MQRILQVIYIYKHTYIKSLRINDAFISVIKFQSPAIRDSCQDIFFSKLLLLKDILQKGSLQTAQQWAAAQLIDATSICPGVRKLYTAVHVTSIFYRNWAAAPRTARQPAGQTDRQTDVHHLPLPLRCPFRRQGEEEIPGEARSGQDSAPTCPQQ